MTQRSRSFFKRILPGLGLVAGLAVLGFSLRPGSVPEYYPADLPETPIGSPAQWRTCSWDPVAADSRAQCARFLVPLDHGGARPDQISLLVKRIVPTGPVSRQVWLVHGGPGASATADMATLTAGLDEVRPDIAFYAVDHRGTGGSERLGCVTGEAAPGPGGAAILPGEWEACLAEVTTGTGDRLRHFSTVEAARDLDLLIHQFRKNDTPVYVYGGSYGTYLVQRYLDLTDEPPAGVILEGLVAADGGMRGYDARMGAVAREFLATCDAAPACSGHFDAPLETEIRQMYAELETGHCRSLNLNPTTARSVLAVMALYAETRVFVPPLVHRIRRCTWSDVRFVARLFRQLATASGSQNYSAVLHNHIVLSEMYRPGVSAPDLMKQYDAAVLSTGAEAGYAALFPTWPRYPKPDPVIRREVQLNVPVLVLQGGLDIAAPADVARGTTAGLNTTPVHFILFPEGAHGVTGGTPMATGQDCARLIYAAFLDAPSMPPDTRCIREILPLDWFSSGTDRFLPGQRDVWGGKGN